MTEPKKTALIVGASRGIGRQIAIDLAQAGYKVVVAAKSTSDASKTHPFPPDPNSQASTINTVAREIVEAGGEAHAVAVDVRDPENVKNMVDATVRWGGGGLDVVVYNSGAIWWASVEDTPMKRFQLMQRVNPEGLYATIQASLPHFQRQGWKARIIVVSPPIYSRFFRGKTAYAMGKTAMTVLTSGLAVDFTRQSRSEMAISSLWPASAIQSAATEFNASSSSDQDEQSRLQDLRKPTIFTHALLTLLQCPAPLVNGLIDTDEDVLRRIAQKTDFSEYAVVEGARPRRMLPSPSGGWEALLRVGGGEDEVEGVRMTSRDRGRGRGRL
ncbi:MAG: hypothetical protein Q9160_002035 [Pyrenula sp. 1 TL-2023]